MSGKQMFAGPLRNHGTLTLIKQALLRSSLSIIPGPYHKVVIYGDSSLPEASSHSKFFLGS